MSTIVISAREIAIKFAKQVLVTHSMSLDLSSTRLDEINTNLHWEAKRGDVNLISTFEA